MMMDLAKIHWSLRQFDRALDLRRRALDGCVRVLGVEHPFTQFAVASYFSSAPRISPTGSRLEGSWNRSWSDRAESPDPRPSSPPV